MIMLPQWFQSLDLIKLRQIPIALRDNNTSSFEYIKAIPECSPPHKRNPCKTKSWGHQTEWFQTSYHFCRINFGPEH